VPPPFELAAPLLAPPLLALPPIVPLPPLVAPLPPLEVEPTPPLELEWPPFELPPFLPVLPPVAFPVVPPPPEALDATPPEPPGPVPPELAPPEEGWPEELFVITPEALQPTPKANAESNIHRSARRFMAAPYGRFVSLRIAGRLSAYARERCAARAGPATSGLTGGLSIGHWFRQAPIDLRTAPAAYSRGRRSSVDRRDAMQSWITPDHEEIPVNSECSAYAGATR
jgi:hypothetical protein